MFYFLVLSHKVIVSVEAQSATSPERCLFVPSFHFFSLSLCLVLWHLSVKRQQKSCFNLSPWLIVCAERMVASFPPFTFSNPSLVFPVNIDCKWITSQIGLDEILPYTVRAFLQHKRHVFSWMKCKQCIKWQLNTHWDGPFVWWLTKMSSVRVWLG